MASATCSAELLTLSGAIFGATSRMFDRFGGFFVEPSEFVLEGIRMGAMGSSPTWATQTLMFGH